MRVIKVNKTTLVQNNSTNLDDNNNNLLLNIAHSPEYAQMRFTWNILFYNLKIVKL